MGPRPETPRRPTLCFCRHARRRQGRRPRLMGPVPPAAAAARQKKIANRRCCAARPRALPTGAGPPPSRQAAGRARGEGARARGRVSCCRPLHLLGRGGRHDNHLRRRRRQLLVLRRLVAAVRGVVLCLDVGVVLKASG